MACNQRELSILFTDDIHIHYLNSRYRGKDSATNVLAFPMSEDPSSEIATGMLGDVVISVDTAIRESEESGESLDKIIDRLLVHGILHLLGYDHERSPRDEDMMRKEEARLLSIIRED